MKKQATYGTWASPITLDVVSAAGKTFSEPTITPEGIFWLERRPQENGRQTIMQEKPSGEILERLPAPHDAGTRMHEYGGGCYAIDGNCIYFVEMSDQRIYQIQGDQINPITSTSALRFADLRPDPKNARLYAACEDHSGEGLPENLLVAVNILDKTHVVTRLATGRDFYSTPQPNPEGNQLAWLSWNNPNMPWDGTELWLATVNSKGLLENPEKIAGGTTESLFQPHWSANGQLQVISDQTGWWNLYRVTEKTLVPLAPLSVDCGLPQWQFGMRTYDCFEDGNNGDSKDASLLCCHGSEQTELLLIQEQGNRPVKHPFARISHPSVHNGQAVFIGSYQDKPTAVVQMDIEQSSFRIVATTPMQPFITPDHISCAEAISFPTKDDKIAHGYFYPPANADFEAEANARPPLIVMSHGGPTTATDSAFGLKIQFWTSRGFAVVDVNYGGSALYGREYRDRLKGNWGVMDVDDCVAAAQYLVRRGDVDADSLCIRGGSAGGYTTLAALAFRDVFKVGASYYGIGDLETLVQDTHKFEARYLDSLIGPYPETKDIYIERSPIHHIDKLSCPVIFFQGLKDKIVPPAQAQAMTTALKKKGLRVVYTSFPDEGHGFIRSGNIKEALAQELAFYGEILKFTPATESQ